MAVVVSDEGGFDLALVRSSPDIVFALVVVEDGLNRAFAGSDKGPKMHWIPSLAVSHSGDAGEFDREPGFVPVRNGLVVGFCCCTELR